MGGIGAAKAEAVAAVIRSLPDGRLRTLKAALAAGAAEAWLLAVRATVDDELESRRLRDAIFPELKLDASVPPGAAAAVWTALQTDERRAVRLAGERLAAREMETFATDAAELVALAAERLAARQGAFAAAAERLERTPGGLAATLRCLVIAPLVRAATPRARAWFRSASPEDASALRLALRDASALCEDGGPALVKAIAAQFTEPYAAIRLVCALMDRPAESFLATTEFAVFGEALLTRLEAEVARVKGFDAEGGCAEGSAAAAAVVSALEAFDELEHAVQLDRTRPWGQKVAQQKRALALAAEAILKAAEKLVAAALPVRPRRPGIKLVRGAPTLNEPLDPGAVTRAEAVLAFIDGSRKAADKGGYGVVRSKVVEVLDGHIDTYVEDLLEQLHAAGEDPDLKGRLEVAAAFLGMVRDPSAAQIVRRRMAAAA